MQEEKLGNQLPSFGHEDYQVVGCDLDTFVDTNYSGHSYFKEILITLFRNKATAVSLFCISLSLLDGYGHRGVSSQEVFDFLAQRSVSSFASVNASIGLSQCVFH